MKTVLSLKPHFSSDRTSAAKNQNTPTPMQTNRKKLPYYAAIAGALLALMTGSALAQNVLLDFSTNSIFATNNFAGSWHWWGGAGTTQEFSYYDAGNNPASGSLKITATWPTDPGADWQYAVGLPLSGIKSYDITVTLNPLSYTNMEMDILWDTNSTANVTNLTGGDPNNFGLGFVATQYGQTWVPNANQPVLVNDGQWHHYTIPINSAWPVIPGVIFKKWTGFNSNNVGTTSIFYVDNIKFNFNTNQSIPRPQMVLQTATKGLNIHAAQSGSQYQRNGVSSLPGASHWWVGNTNPVTYSLTIGEFPNGTTYGGYQAHIFLSTDGGTTEPDWNNPNVIFVQFQENGSGGGICNFRFKTNSPNSNGGFFGTGAIMSKTWPSILGTWSVTFTNNSSITVVGPDGTGTNFDMGGDAATNWFLPVTGSMATYFGCQPNNPANIGQKMVYSRLTMTDGGTNVFDDTFPLEDPSFEIDPTLWIAECDAATANALKVVDEAAYWLDWNKPDGFLTALNVSSNVVSGWVDPGFPILDFGTRRGIYATVTNTLADYQNAAYFKLVTTNSLH
jgi:hypothetical protein